MRPSNQQNLLQNIFGHPKMSVVVMVIAIVGRIIQLVFFYNIRVDASYQVLATDNFLHGHGFSIGEVLAGNLSETVYTNLVNWPPGYSFLLAPFYVLFHHQYIPAGITLDIIAAIGFIFISRKILQRFALPIYLVNLFTLLAGFYIYYFYFIASSDAIAITFFLAGIYYCLKILALKQFRLRYLLALVTSLFFAGFIKYLFIPVVFIVPLFFLAKAFAGKNKAFMKTALYSLLFLGISLGGLLIYLKMVGGTVGYISSPERGFYPRHLVEMYPFISAAFIKPDTLSLLNETPSFVNIIYLASQWASLFMGFILIVLFFKKFSWQSLRKDNNVADFYFLTFAISAALTLLLMILSLTVAKEEILPGYFWTYVEEARYFGLLTILIHLGIFTFYSVVQQGKIYRYLFFFFLIALLPDVCRGILFDLNRVAKFGKETYSWQAEKQVQDYADSLITNLRQERKNVQIVVTGSSYYHNHRISLTSHVPILYDAQKWLDASQFNATAPVLLLIMTSSKIAQAQQKDLKGPIGQIDKFFFYTRDVQPH